MIYISIIISVIVIFAVLIAYVKIKYKFWSSQPVFHFYDLKYHMFPPGIIHPELPEKNKFFRYSTQHFSYDETTPSILSDFYKFIETQYLRSKDARFTPSKNEIHPYFVGHNNKSYVSVTYTNKLLENTKTQNISSMKEIESCMTTRPLYCKIHTKNDKLPSFECNYVDYLCVNKEHRGKGIACETIYTHAYHTRRKNNKVVVSIFKREDELTAIMPMCTYTMVGFDMRKWFQAPTIPPNIGQVVPCIASNIYKMSDFIEFNKKNYDFFATSSISNIIELMKTGNIYIYVLITPSGEIQSMYFFRNSCLWYDSKSKVLTLFASIQGNIPTYLFCLGAKAALMNIRNRHREYSYLVVEDVSDNNHIIKNLEEKTRPTQKSPAGYFFYNFAYPSFKPNKVLIIN